MTKVANFVDNTKSKYKDICMSKSVAPLDTLAQLSNNNITPLINSDLEKLKKRAKAKFISDKITLKLADLQPTKKTKQTFYNTYHCSRLLIQEGKKITSRYCNNRWCIVCNRIRAAKLIAGYSLPLSTLKNPYMVTLTIPNKKSDILKAEVDSMFTALNKIRKSLHYRKTKVVGIRKFEITYNFIRDDYHPHFHLIVEGKQVANDIVNEWLLRYPDANIKGQDVRKADTNSMAELFKYFTKMFSKQGVNIKALDVMIKALKDRRIVQPMGIKKEVSEDVDELETLVYNELEENVNVWEYFENDWYSYETGEQLTGFEPSETLIELSKKIY